MEINSTSMDSNFNVKRTSRSKTSGASRKEEVAVIRSKFPNKVPELSKAVHWPDHLLLRTRQMKYEERKKIRRRLKVIVDRFYKELSLPQLDKTKFLVPQEITMSQFVTIIRNRMQLGSTQAFYLLVNNRSMVSLSKTIAEVYSEHQDDDGFLHVTYASQEVFGSNEVGP